MRVGLIALLLAGCGLDVTGLARLTDSGAPGLDGTLDAQPLDAPPRDVPIVDVGFVDAGGPWLGDSAFRRQVVVRTAPSPLSDFVVGVIVVADDSLQRNARGDGTDVAFTADDETTILPYEVERFDSTTGELVAWVRVPELRTDGPTVLFLYYGGEPIASDAEGTWNGWAGVWHIGEAPTGPNPRYLDSTASQNHGSVTADDFRPGRTAGIAGFGVDMDGVDDQISIGDPSDGSLDFGMRSFSYGLWVHVTSSAGMFDMPWHKGGSNNMLAGYGMAHGTDSWNASVGDGVDNIVGRFGRVDDFLGRWHHMVAVVDRGGNELRLYADGALVDTEDIASLGDVSTARGASIGRTAFPFLGRVDEMRVYDGVLTRQWLEAEHSNLTDDSFVTVGAAVAR